MGDKEQNTRGNLVPDGWNGYLRAMKLVAVLLGILAMLVPLGVGAPLIVLHSAEGSKLMEVSITGLDPDAGTVSYERKNGSRTTARLSSFAEADRPRIERYYQRHLAPGRESVQGHRIRSNPTAVLEDLGVDPALEKRVVRGLDWLKNQQGDDGSFGTKYPVAMTGLALLAYSGHGETMSSERYGETVEKAIDFLLAKGAKSKGFFTSTGRNYQQASYEHAIAVWAVADTFIVHGQAGQGATKMAQVRESLRKAASMIAEGQTKDGGWLYSYGSGGIGDMSVSTWNLCALESAMVALGDFPQADRALRKALGYLKLAAADDGGFRYRIKDSQKGKLSLAGNGLLSYWVAGAKAPQQDRSAKLILSKAPKAGATLDLVVVFPQANALYAIGGASWAAFERSHMAEVAIAQRVDGSWVETRGFAAALTEDLPILSTCLAVLTLEVYYR